MPKVKVTKAHALPLDQAKSLMKTLIEDFQAKNAAMISEVSWSPDGMRATAKGPMFKGTFEVSASQVVCDIDLSMMASPFKGKVESGLNRKLDQFFGA